MFFWSNIFFFSLCVDTRVGSFSKQESFFFLLKQFVLQARNLAQLVVVMYGLGLYSKYEDTLMLVAAYAICNGPHKI